MDLVTGVYNVSTNTFGNIAATDITLGGSRLELDVLNIQTGRNFSNSATIDAGISILQQELTLTIMVPLYG